MVLDKLKQAKKAVDDVRKAVEPITGAAKKTLDVSGKIAATGMQALSGGLNKAARHAGDTMDATVDKAAGHKTIKCPRCQSFNVNHAGNKRKGFSVGKAVGGSMLAGGIGGLAGFAGKQGKKDNWVCADCGRKFTK